MFILESGEAQDINFADDTFTLDRERIIELCGLLENKKRVFTIKLGIRHKG